MKLKGEVSSQVSIYCRKDLVCGGTDWKLDDGSDVPECLPGKIVDVPFKVVDEASNACVVVVVFLLLIVTVKVLLLLLLMLLLNVVVVVSVAIRE